MTPAPTKKVTKSKEPSITEKLDTFYKNELETNGAPKDKNTFDDLRKKAWTDEGVNLNENSRSMTKRVLQKVMKDNNYEVPQGVFDKPKSSSESEGVVGDFIDSARKAVGLETDQNPQNTENKGTGIFQNLTKTETIGKSDQGESQTQIVSKERPPLPAEKKESYKRLFKKGFSMPANMMIQLGFVEGELKNEEKPKSFTEQVDEFAEDLAVYCFENNIPLPPMMELIAILASGAMIFGVPVITKVMGMKKDKKKEEKKEEKHTLSNALKDEKEDKK